MAGEPRHWAPRLALLPGSDRSVRSDHGPDHRDVCECAQCKREPAGREQHAIQGRAKLLPDRAQQEVLLG